MFSGYRALAAKLGVLFLERATVGATMGDIPYFIRTHRKPCQWREWLHREARNFDPQIL